MCRFNAILPFCSSEEKPSVWQPHITCGFTFSEYIKNATITVDSAKNMNYFVTKAEADSLMDILWNGRMPGQSCKYP